MEVWPSISNVKLPYLAFNFTHFIQHSIASSEASRRRGFKERSFYRQLDKHCDVFSWFLKQLKVVVVRLEKHKLVGVVALIRLYRDLIDSVCVCV